VIERIQQGWSPAAYDRDPEEGEASVLRLSAVKDGVFHAGERKALPELTAEELENAPKLREGDFLLTRANTPSLVGDCAIAEFVPATIFSDLIYRLTFSADILPAFALRCLRSAQLRGQIRSDARGSSMTMAKLSHGHIKSWCIALPPLAEQEAIAAELNYRLARFAELIAEAEEATKLLQERRAALISATVTGKIDVRAVAPRQAEAA
jgi:type I restriction enzyme S subunit